jgi:uncharacterized protein YsxB (DUF464 family)
VTTVTVYKTAGGRIKAFRASGHAQEDHDGDYDLVCAGVSAITHSAVLGMLRVMHIRPEIQSDEDSGFLAVKLPQDLTERQQEDVHLIISTMLAGLEGIREQYSQYLDIVIMEVDKDEL